MRSIPKKGQGFTAAQTTPKGYRVLSEEPVFTVSRMGKNHDLLTQEIANELRQIAKDNRRAYLGVHNSHRGSLPSC